MPNILHPMSSPPVSEEDGRIIIESGQFLGTSHSIKGTFWACYKHLNNFYISLNSDYESVYLSNEETMGNYIDIDPSGNLIH